MYRDLLTNMLNRDRSTVTKQREKAPRDKKTRKKIRGRGGKCGSEEEPDHTIDVHGQLFVG